MTVRKVNKTENKECNVKVVIKRNESAVAVTAGGVTPPALIPLPLELL